MRLLLPVALVLGCGRIYFDPTAVSGDGRGDDGSTGNGDGSSSSICGDNLCEGLAGETCLACGECNTQEIVCGNDQCQTGEGSGACPRDCGPFPWPSAWANEETLLAAAVNAHRTAGSDCPSTMNMPVPALNTDPRVILLARWFAWNFVTSTDQTTGVRCNGHDFVDVAAVAGVGGAGGITNCWDIGTGSAQMSADLYMTSTTLCNSVVMRATGTAIGTGYAETALRRCWYTVVQF